MTSFRKVIDVEENIWSAMYGLKGKVDAVVEIRRLSTDGTEKIWTVPYELKTGYAQSLCHVVQTTVYTLIMSDRYGKYSIFLINTGRYRHIWWTTPLFAFF